MPTYAYTCKDCGHDLEVVQSFTDDPLTTCPVCQGSLRKVFNSVGVVFKGSGFYRTDSRSSSSATAPAASSSSSDSSGTSTSASSGSASSSSSNSGPSSAAGA